MQQLFICSLHLHTVATLLRENLNCIIMTLLTNVKYCGCTMYILKISSFFPRNYCPTELKYYNNFLFHPHCRNSRSYMPGPVNLKVSRCSITQLWCIYQCTVLAITHCLAGICNHSNGTSGRSISCTSIQLNIMVICNSKNLSLVRFHCYV